MAGLTRDKSAKRKVLLGRSRRYHPARMTQEDVRPSDPVDLAPTNAWLLIGGEESFYTDGELRQARREAMSGLHRFTWTVAKQTEPGDLLFYYFTQPRKAIHFVARAVDNAFFEDIGDTGERWNGSQWWCHTSAPISVEPVTLAQLQKVIGKTVMAGRSGRYIRPEHAAELANLIHPQHDTDANELSRVLQPVVGRADKPSPDEMTLDDWRLLAAGSLDFEEHVERYLVEPLLRMALEDRRDAQVRKRYVIGRRIADYAVLTGGRVSCVIEVKMRVRMSAAQTWRGSKDLKQVRDYATRLDSPAILMDAFSVHLIPRGGSTPIRTLRRRDFTESDVRTVAQHIIGG